MTGLTAAPLPQILSIFSVIQLQVHMVDNEPSCLIAKKRGICRTSSLQEIRHASSSRADQMLEITYEDRAWNHWFAVDVCR